MALNFQEEDLIYTLAYECESQFNKLIQALPKAKPEGPIIELCADYQQRFAIWTAYLGVFARRSQCLDTRLRNFPDLQDLVTRLLDILYCSLQHCLNEMTSQRETDLGPKGDNQCVLEVSETQKAALKTIGDTITRLDRLGTTIRHSSSSTIDTRVKEHAANQNLVPFASLCANAVQALYPGADQALKEYLSKSMATRFAKMLFFNSRNKNLRARRGDLPTITEVPERETPTHEYAKGQANPVVYLSVPQAPKKHNAYSESVLSTVDIQHIRNRLRAPDEASTKFHKTSSIQVKQGNYPQAPSSKGGNNIIPCQWCGEPLNIKCLSEMDWRQHIDRDLKPYICLFEECSDGHSAYPTFNEWCRHMKLHDSRWHQKIYLTPNWVCPLCAVSENVYNSPQALYLHLTGSHDKQFTELQLQAISRQSKVVQPRAWNECPFCCLSIEDQEDKEKLLVTKRPKEQQKQESIKRPRISFEISSPGNRGSDLDSSDTSSESGNADSYQQRKDPSNTIARHIAAHLQVLMLLTLRFAALESDGEDLNDDFKSNSVDIDEENTRSFISKDTDLGRSSHQSSLRDVTMEDIDGEKGKEIEKDDTQSLSTGLSFEPPLKGYDDRETEINDKPNNANVAMRPSDTQTAPASQQGGSPSQPDRSTAVPSRLSNIASRPQPALGFNTPPPVLPVIQLQADATAWNSQPPSQLALENKSDTGDEATFSSDISGALMATKKASLSPPKGDAISNDKVGFARSTKNSTTVPNGFGTNAISPKSPRRANLGKSLTLAPWQDDSAVQDGIDPKPEPESASPSGERPKTYPLTKFPGYDFFEAIDKGDIPTIERLLKNGADLEVADEFGRTPLWRAVSIGERSVIQLLLVNGANLEAKNLHKQNILNWAKSKSKPDIVDMIVAAMDARYT
ncbi:uncharacterized protein TrAtP1_001422 [Trichoderma atroviride]|uniref:uncharacterized protein n=1 Tax=Hypocrea atroviridis TaxID=63577 RepID=UPI00331C8F60|nr:hypothetical protein TrAtP1_001422 [Trichoderma atroviride]